MSKALSHWHTSTTSFSHLSALILPLKLIEVSETMCSLPFSLWKCEANKAFVSMYDVWSSVELAISFQWLSLTNYKSCSMCLVWECNTGFTGKDTVLKLSYHTSSGFICWAPRTPRRLCNHIITTISLQLHELNCNSQLLLKTLKQFVICWSSMTPNSTGAWDEF